MISLKNKNSDGGDNRAIAVVRDSSIHEGKTVYLNTLPDDNFELWVNLKSAVKNILFQDPEYMRLIEKVDVNVVAKLNKQLENIRSETESDEDEPINATKTRTKTFDSKVDNMYEKSKKILERIYTKEFILFDKDAYLEPIIDLSEATVYAYFGPSGCGKSYKLNKMLEQIQERYPKIKFYLFSKVSDDYPTIKNMIRIPTSGPEAIEILGLDKKTKERKLRIEDLSNSIVIFDDVGTIANKDICASVALLENEILEVYRHNNITPFFTQHVLANGLRSRTLINEVSHMTLYPGANWENIRKYLERNGFGRMIQARIKELNKKSRSITIYKNNPQLILYDKGVMIL